jgi:hypothetical protein
MKKFLAFLLSAALFALPMAAYPQGAGGGSATPYANSPRFGATFPALEYGQWDERASSGGGTAGTTYSLSMPRGYAVTEGGGAPFVPYSVLVPISVGIGAVQETVTPTAVSGCGVGVNAPNLCTITAAFTYAHGVGTAITSSTRGLDEAVLVANGNGGGQVEIDAAWYGAGGTAANITAAPVFPNVSISDFTYGIPRNWNATPTGLALPAPTLPAINITGQAACDATHQMCSDANVAGSASWGGTVYACWTYVDIMGNEGPCSATTSWTSVASKAIDLGIPAASPGAVGAIPYLSLSGGSYALAYQIPVTSSVCTMTKLETITPACAVTNTSLGQVGSTFGAGGLFTTGGAQITTYPVNTAMLAPVLATTAQTITAQHPMTNSSLTYSYAPGARVGACGASSINTVQLAAAGGISGSSATTVPQPLGSWTIPAGCFNYIGAEFRIKGKFTYTDGGSGTSTKVIASWDSNVTNTASVPTPLCSILDTFTSVAGADNVVWECTVKILTTGASGTALVNGISVGSIAAGQTTLVRSAVDNAVAASAAIDLATNARISVQFQATGATSNPGAQTLEASLEWLN